ncbi:hypothetical protein GV819_26545 [Pseudomonas sp. Fl5BN2]|uniref:SMI1/KNR4 family protein n=1 Tax=unclassified Pseudomonas TaxID=196821 RepID=UPI001376EDB8|nr:MULTISPECIES: SMI1/KNR4 family protein [unclassified Pseudomonas]NBF05861.1 hypothetical protein [Pseudomonas sp. Fl5BN2]NBF11430.1 hypothetical protein [Pseudomonas sp. Fl4BN1]
MNDSDFKQLLAKRKCDQPIWFALPADRCASEDDISGFEQAWGLQLPGDYRQFLKAFGGGYFALGIVYSLDEASDLNLPRINRAHPVIAQDHLLFSENGCGDFYGFKIENHQCRAEIFCFDHASAEWQETGYRNLLSFLAEVALSN